MIDLLLINPPYHKASYGALRSDLAAVEPPLWCALLAAYIRKQGYSVKIIDIEAEDKSLESSVERINAENPTIVVIVVLGSNPSASSTPKMAGVRDLLILLKKSFSGYIALCGLHPSALPEKTLNEEMSDFVIQGEGFYTILELLKKLKYENIDYNNVPGLWYRLGEKIMFNSIPQLMNLDDLPIAAWDLLPMNKYRAHNWHCFGGIGREPYGVIYTSLGCPFKCSYCNIHAMYGGISNIRYRDPEKVLEEIDLLVNEYNIKNIKIVDELFALNEEHVNDICKKIINRKYDLNIWAYARADTVNSTMLKNMKSAGINWLGIGYESANESVRLGVSKKIKTSINQSVKIIHDAGIHIIGNFIFGLPGDTLETMQETLNLAMKLNCEYINFYTAIAYPGSKLYIDCIKKGTKLPKTWLGYSQLGEDTLPLPTEYLSSETILRFRDDAFVKYFSRSEYINMIRYKFSNVAEDHIKYMLSHGIKRRYA